MEKNITTINRTTNTSALKNAVQGIYDIQKMRIMDGQRAVAGLKAKLGLPPSTKEEEMDSEGKRLLKLIRASYKRMTDGAVLVTRRNFKPDEEGIISDFAEFTLVQMYDSLLQAEERAVSNLKPIVEQFALWNMYLKDVKGVGPMMAAVIISSLDIRKAKYPSSFWKYCGLDVAPDGKARSKRAEHLVDREYVDKDGETKIKKGLTFKPFIRTKLLGVLGGSFLKAKHPKYSKIYYDARTRYENRPDLAESTKGHRHNMAMRYMIKMFLIDLHVEWCKIEGLPVQVPYHEAKLGIKHTA